jgi:hypothetical protein
LAQYHFYAEEWDQCYQTIIAHFAADSIINGNLITYCHEFCEHKIIFALDNFKETWELLRELQRHSHEIDGWHEHGQVYFSYLQLREELESIKYHSAEDRLEAITQKVVSVCTQLRNMPCSSPKER